MIRFRHVEKSVAFIATALKQNLLSKDSVVNQKVAMHDILSLPIFVVRFENVKNAGRGCVLSL